MLAQAEGLAAEMLRHGTTALEGKSGYGLSIERERARSSPSAGGSPRASRSRCA